MSVIRSAPIALTAAGTRSASSPVSSGLQGRNTPGPAALAWPCCASTVTRARWPPQAPRRRLAKRSTGQGPRRRLRLGVRGPPAEHPPGPRLRVSCRRVTPPSFGPHTRVSQRGSAQPARAVIGSTAHFPRYCRPSGYSSSWEGWTHWPLLVQLAFWTHLALLDPTCPAGLTCPAGPHWSCWTPLVLLDPTGPAGLTGPLGHLIDSLVHLDLLDSWSGWSPATHTRLSVKRSGCCAHMGGNSPPFPCAPTWTPPPHASTWTSCLLPPTGPVTGWAWGPTWTPLTWTHATDLTPGTHGCAGRAKAARPVAFI